MNDENKTLIRQCKCCLIDKEIDHFGDTKKKASHILRRSGSMVSSSNVLSTIIGFSVFMDL